jgi:hypothetical protein
MWRILPPACAIFGILGAYQIYMNSAFASNGIVFMTVIAIISGLGGYSAVELVRWAVKKQREILPPPKP